MLVVERLLDQVGRSVTESEPYVDASLPDGSRLHIVTPPVVLNGPTITIRKTLRRWTMEGFLTETLEHVVPSTTSAATPLLVRLQPEH